MASSKGINTFPRDCRLRRSVEFDRIYSFGRRVGTKHFILYGVESSRAGSRLGLTVSRKIGNAVQRNRIKRVLRDIFRRYKSSHFKSPHDVVINAKRGIEKAPYKNLEEDFCRSVTQLITDALNRRPKG